ASRAATQHPPDDPSVKKHDTHILLFPVKTVPYPVASDRLFASGYRMHCYDGTASPQKNTSPLI
ncbi:MAG: hypothetical protein LIQ30_07090, partial [Planctomycetes bacterium]|nr:hypothetical protein [Planctomycetota bacterium]